MILRWEQGRVVVDDLLARGRLTHVTPNRELADILLVLAQLDPPLGAIFRPFSWMRPLRNHTQYPAPEHPVARAEDVEEATPATAAMIDAAVKVLDRMPGYGP